MTEPKTASVAGERRDWVAFCPRCGHAHHNHLGRLSKGVMGCGVTIKMVSLEQWRSQAAAGRIDLTPAGRRALAETGE